ncbi:MAG: hypothetical protein H0X08_08770 [Blastocatellia bacterium]|nr:hypothetical protein [Blastocatellia bacterium]
MPIGRVKAIADSPSLTYHGIVDRNGQSVHIIGAESTSGEFSAISFDVATSMLAGIVMGPLSITYRDFRKVNEISLPFRIESGSMMSLTLHQVRVNVEVDSALLTPKENCFDKP